MNPLILIAIYAPVIAFVFGCWIFLAVSIANQRKQDKKDNEEWMRQRGQQALDRINRTYKFGEEFDEKI